jgi:hypothetical protein
MPAAFTPADVDRPVQAEGGRYKLVGSIAFSGNYTTGGDPLDFGPLLATIGVGQVDAVDVINRAGFDFDYDFTNKKLMVRQSAAAGNPGTEITGAAAYPAALSSTPAKVVVHGR